MSTSPTINLQKGPYTLSIYKGNCYNYWLLHLIQDSVICSKPPAQRIQEQNWKLNASILAFNKKVSLVCSDRLAGWRGRDTAYIDPKITSKCLPLSGCHHFILRWCLTLSWWQLCCSCGWLILPFSVPQCFCLRWCLNLTWWQLSCSCWWLILGQ